MENIVSSKVAKQKSWIQISHHSRIFFRNWGDLWKIERFYRLKKFIWSLSIQPTETIFEEMETAISDWRLRKDFEMSSVEVLLQWLFFWDHRK
jgi:hypothetical protein